MSRDGRSSAIAIFTAVTRAVRDERMAEDVRAQAFAALEGLAAHVGVSTYEERLERLLALAGEHEDLNAALAPHRTALRSMTAWSPVLKVA